MYRVDGFDVSEFQGTVDWLAVQQRDFVAIRVLDGGYDDPLFQQNWRMASRAGFKHQFVYLLPSDSDPDAQINRTIDAIHATGVPWQPGHGIALDLEPSKPRPTASAETARYLEKQLCSVFGRPHCLWYGHDYVPETTGLTGRPLWYPWPQSNGSIEIPWPVTVHQWGTAAPGEYPGFHSSVDVNQVNDPQILDVTTGITPLGDGFTVADLDAIHAMINTATDNLSNVVVAQAKTLQDQLNVVLSELNSLKDPTSPMIQEIVKNLNQTVTPSVDSTRLAYILARVIGDSLSHVVLPS